MTNRLCQKCGDKLVTNEKLGIMECVSGRHLEPINLIRAQFWNRCPKCGQMGVNDRSEEAILRVKERMMVEVDGKQVSKKLGVFKDGHALYERNSNQKPYKCKACGYQFTKKGATAQ